MASDIEYSVNPGEKLREILEQLYPFTASESKSYISKMDSALYADGELASLVYRSTINYMLRRLVSAAVFVKRRCKKNGLPEESIEIEIKKFINNIFDFPNATVVEQIASLLFICTKMRKATINITTEKIVRDRNENLCYICGRDLDFFNKRNEFNEKNDAWAELEHLFPKSMGGSSKLDSNLKYACTKCNAEKKSYIDDSDYHYEQICFVTDEDDGVDFHGNFKQLTKLALWSKNQYKCQFCNEPASRVGRLHLTRRNPEDNWHFLNIETYCSAHILMIKKKRE
jgi:5-methylcytosine-specific restriction endonuclease McrA